MDGGMTLIQAFRQAASATAARSIPKHEKLTVVKVTGQPTAYI